MLKIRGYNQATWETLPPPADVDIGYFDLVQAERAEDGTMYINFIAEKMRIDVTWKVLTNSQWSQILEAIRDRRPYFYIQLQVQSGSIIEALVYVGDRKAKMGHIRNGVRYWYDATVSFIQV